MKIIFLDIDGVLNVHRQEHDKYGSLFHENFVDNLATIIKETSAKIIISSSWRLNGLPAMQQMWVDRNLPGEVVGITPYIHGVARGTEIAKWLFTRYCDGYVIIDDDDDMLPSQMNNFVKTSDNFDHEDKEDIGYGLTKKCAEKAIEILNKV